VQLTRKYIKTVPFEEMEAVFGCSELYGVEPILYSLKFNSWLRNCVPYMEF
jgi:hypothetical protein